MIFSCQHVSPVTDLINILTGFSPSPPLTLSYGWAEITGYYCLVYIGLHTGLKIVIDYQGIIAEEMF